LRFTRTRQENLTRKHNKSVTNPTMKYSQIMKWNQKNGRTSNERFGATAAVTPRKVSCEHEWK